MDYVRNHLPVPESQQHRKRMQNVDAQLLMARARFRVYSLIVRGYTRGGSIHSIIPGEKARIHTSSALKNLV